MTFGSAKVLSTMFFALFAGLVFLAGTISRLRPESGL